MYRLQTEGREIPSIGLQTMRGLLLMNITAAKTNDISTGIPESLSNHSGGKFLSFFLDCEEYGIEILKVQEIIGMMTVTRVPRTPDFVRGVINLRGKVIPIVDLRAKFGMESVEQTDETCIIVVKTEGVEIGIVVDRVSEVLAIAAKDIDDTPSFGIDLNTDFILGIGKSGAKVKILLDIDKVLSAQDTADLHSIASVCQTEAAPMTV
jgi:purine-binding chemotaxis protein CheW